MEACLALENLAVQRSHYQTILFGNFLRSDSLLQSDSICSLFAAGAASAPSMFCILCMLPVPRTSWSSVTSSFRRSFVRSFTFRHIFAYVFFVIITCLVGHQIIFDGKICHHCLCDHSGCQLPAVSLFLAACLTKARTARVLFCLG